MTIKDGLGTLRNYGCSFPRIICVGLDNLLTYFNLKKPFLAPLYIGWDVTFRCNLHCDSCQTHRFVTQDQELTTEECLRIIKQLGRLKASIVSLTGGEPFVRDDIFILLQALKEEKIQVNLNTNGILLERYVDDIINSSLSTLTVSILNSSDGCPTDNNFNLIQEKVIKKIIIGRKKNRPHVIAAFTLTRKNAGSISNLISYWKEKADEILLQPVHHSQTSIFRCSDPTSLFAKGSASDFRRTLDSLMNKQMKLQTAYVREFYNFFFNRDMLRKKYRCFAGSFMLQIDAYGNVYPCPEFVEKLGSLRQIDLEGIVNNLQTRRFREFVRNKRNKCFCWYRCTGRMNYYLNRLLNPMLLELVSSTKNIID